MGVEAVIKPRRNSRLDTPSEPRRRWSVETAYSTFKRTFGEFRMAKTMKNIS